MPLIFSKEKAEHIDADCIIELNSDPVLKNGIKSRLNKNRIIYFTAQKESKSDVISKLAVCYTEALIKAVKRGFSSAAVPIIRPDSSVTIQEAINTAVSGITAFLKNKDITVYLSIPETDFESGIPYEKEITEIIGVERKPRLKFEKAEALFPMHPDASECSSPGETLSNFEKGSKEYPAASSSADGRNKKVSAPQTQRPKFYAEESIGHGSPGPSTADPNNQVVLCEKEYTHKGKSRKSFRPAEEDSVTAVGSKTSTDDEGDELTRLLNSPDESFAEMLLRKIDEKGMTDPDCYRKANVDRKLFSKIKNKKDYRPTKPTVLAFAISLELSKSETDDLLRKAGFAFNPSDKGDIIVEFFINKKIYDIHKINLILFKFDQYLLGSVVA